MSSSTFFIEIQHNPPKIINIGQTIDGMEQIDISLDENDLDIKAERLKEKIGEMNKTSESQPESEQEQEPEPEPEPAPEPTQETPPEPAQQTPPEPAQQTSPAQEQETHPEPAPVVPTITGSGKRRKTKRNKKKRINKKKRLTKRSK